MKARRIFELFLRDADQRGLPDSTKCSLGWWSSATADDLPQFNARLALSLGEIRALAKEECAS